MSRLSDLTNYAVNETPNLMEIRTERVEPLTSSVTDRIYKFRLEPQGFLDSNSLLQFKLTADPNSVTGDGNLRVNCFNGALGAIKRVIFQVGDWIISDTDGVNQIQTLMELGPQRRVNLNNYHAWYYGNQLHTKFDTTTGAAAATWGQLVPDDTLSGFNYTTPAANSLQISTSASSFKYGIKLGTLIPALKNQQIPLFLFNEYRIYITVEFHAGSSYCNSDHATTNDAEDSDIIISNVQLLCDYIIFPSSIQEKVMNQTAADGGFVLSYINWIKSEQQLNVDAGTNTSIATNAQYTARGFLQDKSTAKDFRLGVEGREVHTVVMWKQFSYMSTVAGYKVMLGERCDGIAHEEIQWEINGVNYYPQPITSTASQFDQAYQALGYKDLQVERTMFFNDRNSCVAGMAQVSSGLNGTYKPLMLDLRTNDVGVVAAGTLQGRYPIVCKYSCTPALSCTTYGEGNTGNAVSYRQDSVGGAYPYYVDFFIACSRQARITSTPKGMQVQIIE